MTTISFGSELDPESRGKPSVEDVETSLHLEKCHFQIDPRSTTHSATQPADVATLAALRYEFDAKVSSTDKLCRVRTYLECLGGKTWTCNEFVTRAGELPYYENLNDQDSRWIKMNCVPIMSRDV